jgi:deoxycytidylate deaminase
MIIPGDPTFIPDKDKYFMNIAKAVAAGSNHPIAPGGCVIVRDREIVGDGRSVLADCKVEVDCITYAIGTAAKRGTPINGAEVYSTRYPFAHCVFQLYTMGIRKITVVAHEWEPYYKDEFRRAARLARELAIAIEPLFDDDEQTYGTSNEPEDFDNRDLYSANPIYDDTNDIV